jgi:cellulose synthase/poly-beta-1,6-N-acetylglucosamine synthase-like glycosyltransferase
MLYSIVIGIYSICMVVFCLFGLHRLWMLWLYMRGCFAQRQGRIAWAKNWAKNISASTSGHAEFCENWPIVTIQLPIYNEQYVVERLIDAVCQIDYPTKALEIQILDDSSDDTTHIITKLVAEKQREGFNIKAIRRSTRTGFKAGALHEGLMQCQGDYVLIFDADFIPPPHILRIAIPYFANPKVGLVQFPWDHINRHYSFLTWAQSVFLDGHFHIEHFARNRSGRFFNFNGTAGIWRKQCIFDAGGWQGDTLTEDLDLSYRAQLKGWTFIYVPDCPIPAELPVELNAFKSQQYRWAKGGVQTAIKLLPIVLRAPIPTFIKLEAIFHLTANMTYVVMPFYILTLPILVMCSVCMPTYIHLITAVAAFASIIAFYLVAQFHFVRLNPVRNVWGAIAVLPILMAISIALCINNSRAVLDALLSRKATFVRTPKYNIAKRKDLWKHRKNYRVKVTSHFLIELFFLGYLSWVGILSVLSGAYHLVPFIAVFILGFLYFAVLTLQQFYIK